MNTTRFPASDPPSQLCAFLLDGIHLGVDVRYVQEVLRFQRTTPVPLAPRCVSGLINLRGNIVTSIDLRARLGFPVRTSQQDQVNVVVRYDGSTVALLVDDIGDIVTVEAKAFEPVPPTLDPRIKSIVRGVYKQQAELLLLLDPALTLQIEGSGAARTDVPLHRPAGNEYIGQAPPRGVRVH